jgi:OTU domain-containing protein 6
MSHEHAKDTLVAAAQSIPNPPPAISLNPLLARRPLKKAKGGSKKKTTTLKDVKKAKAEELVVISSDYAPDAAEQGEVLDLADQLLEQLGGDLEDTPAAQPVAIGGASNSTAAKSQPLSPVSTSSPSSSARERLHGLKEDFKDAFLPNRNTDANGEKKVGRQQARKVHFSHSPPTLLSLLPADPCA